MKDEELAAVLAHELGHVKNRDILIGSIAATLASAITYLARMAMWSGSGRRESGRRDRIPRPRPVDDLSGADGSKFDTNGDFKDAGIQRGRDICPRIGTAQPMISALEKLDSVGKQIPLQASPSMSHMYIMQPFSGTAFLRLFSTHPTTEKRIAALCALGRRSWDAAIAA
jgi:heat shock protein HtpX